MTAITPMLPEEAAAATTSGSRRRRVTGPRWRLLVRTPGRVAGLAIIALFVVLAIIGPYLYPKNLPVDPNAIYAPPSLSHLLGTDFEGTDVLALVITGTRYMLLPAVVAGLITMVIGTAAGIAGGYYRGLRACALMRLTDIVLTVPAFPLLVVLSTIWDFGSPWAMGLVLGVTGWGGIARAVRSQTLSLRERGFIEAARGLGLPGRRIITREVLPNVAPCIAMNLLLSVTGAIYAEAGLYFLGVVPFKAGNWGVMLHIAVFSAGALTSPQALAYVLSPLVCILLLTIGIVLVRSAVDEWFNPRLREV
jgi:peptide/nickel transport system permease protein